VHAERKEEWVVVSISTKREERETLLVKPSRSDANHYLALPWATSLCSISFLIKQLPPQMLSFNNMNKGVKDARKIHIPNGVVFLDN
jgi:hypothetical protein